VFGLPCPVPDVPADHVFNAVSFGFNQKLAFSWHQTVGQADPPALPFGFLIGLYAKALSIFPN
jgi:hypothetical protein